MNSTEIFNVTPECADHSLKNLTTCATSSPFYKGSVCPDFSAVVEEIAWIYELQGNLDPRVLLQKYLPKYCWDDRNEVVAFACAAALNWKRVSEVGKDGQLFVASFLPFVVSLMYGVLLNTESDPDSLDTAKKFLFQRFSNIQLTNEDNPQQV